MACVAELRFTRVFRTTFPLFFVSEGYFLVQLHGEIL